MQGLCFAQRWPGVEAMTVPPKGLTLALASRPERVRRDASHRIGVECNCRMQRMPEEEGHARCYLSTLSGGSARRKRPEGYFVSCARQDSLALRDLAACQRIHVPHVMEWGRLA